VKERGGGRKNRDWDGRGERERDRTSRVVLFWAEEKNERVGKRPKGNRKVQGPRG